MLLYQLKDTNEYFYDTTMVSYHLGVSRSCLKRILKDYQFGDKQAIVYKNRLLIHEMALPAIKEAIKSKQHRSNKIDLPEMNNK